MVQRDGEQYLMWYYSQGTTTYNPPTSLPLGDIALATSPDGFNWTRQEVCSSSLSLTQQPVLLLSLPVELLKGFPSQISVSQPQK